MSESTTNKITAGTNGATGNNNELAKLCGDAVAEGAVMINEKRPPSLCLKWNGCFTYTNCGICGCGIGVDTGLCLFLEGTCDFVCCVCGKRHAPNLHEAQIGWERWNLDQEDEMRKRAAEAKSIAEMAAQIFAEWKKQHGGKGRD